MSHPADAAYPNTRTEPNGVAFKMWYYVTLGAILVALIVVFFIVRKKGE